jgi:CRISPR/Cas system Type II protein with McrA/HNH and RuvC-like nuclease domain
VAVSLSAAVAEAQKETVQLALKRLRQSAQAVAEAVTKGVRSALRKRLKRLRERLKARRRHPLPRKRQGSRQHLLPKSKKRKPLPDPVAEAVQNSSAVCTAEIFSGLM